MIFLMKFVYFVWPIVIAVSILTFLSGAMRYKFSKDSKSAEDAGQRLMSIAIIAVALAIVVLFFLRSV